MLKTGQGTRTKTRYTSTILEGVFPFLSPYYHLTVKYDSLFDMILCVGCIAEKDCVEFRRFFLFLSQLSRYKKSQPSLPTEMSKLFCEKAQFEFDEVIFRICAILSFLRTDIDMEKVRREFNVCFISKKKK